MKNNSFLISGFGRSGTKFLSDVMNKSNKWVVKHEPRGSYDLDIYKKDGIIPKRIKDTFDQEYYGEVNSYMRGFIKDIEVSKRGIILRNPENIYKSLLNRTDKHEFILKTLDEIHEYWYKFHYLLKTTNIQKIEFEKMTTDIEYLNKILFDFGIYDVVINETIINNKINTNKSEKYKSFDDIPLIYKNKFYDYDWSIT